MYRCVVDSINVFVHSSEWKEVNLGQENIVIKLHRVNAY